MKAVYAPLAIGLAQSAHALVARQAGCCFELTAQGAQSGTVGQLSDGQNRIGGNLPAGRYCINDGGITDGQGRGCILTPPTTQFQCDQGAGPTYGFSISSSGLLQYSGNTAFVACPTGDNGAYNIYTTAPTGQGGCVSVTLSTGGTCISGASSASAPASSAPASSAPASSAPASSAPASSAPASSAPASSAPASSAPASSAPAASAPASSAPVSSPPVSSAPVSSAPAASAPASSAPVSSAPASSAPAPSVSDSTSCTTFLYTYPASSAPASSAPATSALATSTPATSAPAASAPATSAPASSAPASSTVKSSACATTLGSKDAYQTPELIVPVNKNSPDTAYGTQYNAYLSSENSTIFNFNIPTSYSGRQCSLVFLFPEQSQLETSSYTVSGSGGLTFTQLSNLASQSTTYANAGSGSQVGSIDMVSAGNSYVVYSGACPAGTTKSIEVSTTGSLSLSFFEDYNPSPIGLFITSC